VTEKVARGFVSRLFEWSGALVGRKLSLIFVVDDEKIIATTLAAILSQSGFRAEAFTNPLDALKKAHTEAPDLLLSDVVMPEMSGIDLAIQLREVCPSCRILLFSGQAATSDMLDVARKQGHEFNILSKPVHPTDLLAAISSLSASKADGLDQIN
jgi:CheY-like chemotaxis protein